MAPAVDGFHGLAFLRGVREDTNGRPEGRHWFKPNGRRFERVSERMGASVCEGVVAPARGEGRPGNGLVDRFSPERAEPLGHRLP